MSISTAVVSVIVLLVVVLLVINIVRTVFNLIKGLFYIALMAAPFALVGYGIWWVLTAIHVI